MMRFLAPVLRRLWPPAAVDVFDPIASDLGVVISAAADVASREQARHDHQVRAAIADCFERMGHADSGLPDGHRG